MFRARNILGGKAAWLIGFCFLVMGLVALVTAPAPFVPHVHATGSDCGDCLAPCPDSGDCCDGTCCGLDQYCDDGTCTDYCPD